MEIILNGDRVTVASAELRDVLEQLGYECKKVVVAVNESFVARDAWEEHRLDAGDRLDVLAAIEGG